MKEMCNISNVTVSHYLGRATVLVRFQGSSSHFKREAVSPHVTREVEAHLYPAIRHCLLNIFAATFHIRKLNPPPASRSCAICGENHCLNYQSEYTEIMRQHYTRPLVMKELAAGFIFKL